MKRLLLVGALIGAFTAPAIAQVNVVPSPGLTTGYLARQTYSAGFIGLSPAASTTDLICIAGGTGKIVRLMNLRISGSGTAISVPATLVRRVAADTGGTAATTTANPANNITKRDTTNGTPVATVIAYSANPTIVDTAPTYLDSANLGVVATTVGVVDPVTEFHYARDVENFLQTPTLRGPAEQICLNLNGTSATAVLSGTIVWTEE